MLVIDATKISRTDVKQSSIQLTCNTCGKDPEKYIAKLPPGMFMCMQCVNDHGLMDQLMDRVKYEMRHEAREAIKKRILGEKK